MAPRFPMDIAFAYYQELEREVITPMKNRVEKEITEKRLSRYLMRMLGDGSDVREDDTSEYIEKTLSEMRVLDEIDERSAKKIAKGKLNDTRKFSIKQADRQFESIAGVMPHVRRPEMRDAMQAALNENIRLIKSIPNKYHDEVERVVREGVQAGHSTRDITEKVFKAGNKTSNNAKLIAHDQVGNMFSSATKKRNTQLGMTHYIWRTVEDDRVRNSHEGFDGSRYTWEDGSPEGHPGEPIRCRCWAQTPEDQILQKYSEESDVPEPSTIVSDDGNFDRNQINDITADMSPEEEYNYRMGIADESSNKRISMVHKNADYSDAKTLNIRYHDVDGKAELYTQKVYAKQNNLVDTQNINLRTNQFLGEIDKFSSFDNLGDQADFLENVLKPRLASIQSPEDFNELKTLVSAFEEHIEATKFKNFNKKKILSVLLDEDNAKNVNFSVKEKNLRDAIIEDKVNEAASFYKKFGNLDVDDIAYKKITGRAGSDASAGLIKVRGESTSSIIHEIGHQVHDNGREKTGTFVRRFFRERTSGLEKVVINGNDEIGYANEFYTPYAGRVYDWESSLQGDGQEIVSTGMEAVYKYADKFKEIDKGHFNLIYGIMRGLI